MRVARASLLVPKKIICFCDVMRHVCSPPRPHCTIHSHSLHISDNSNIIMPQIAMFLFDLLRKGTSVVNFRWVGWGGGAFQNIILLESRHYHLSCTLFVLLHQHTIACWLWQIWNVTCILRSRLYTQDFQWTIKPTWIYIWWTTWTDLRTRWSVLRRGSSVENAYAHTN